MWMGIQRKLDCKVVKEKPIAQFINNLGLGVNNTKKVTKQRLRIGPVDLFGQFQRNLCFIKGP